MEGEQQKPYSVFRASAAPGVSSGSGIRQTDESGGGEPGSDASETTALLSASPMTSGAEALKKRGRIPKSDPQKGGDGGEAVDTKTLFVKNYPRSVQARFMFQSCLWISGLLLIVSLVALLVSEDPITLTLLQRNWWLLLVELGLIVMVGGIYLFNFFSKMNETAQLFFLILSLFISTSILCLFTALETSRAFITGAFLTSLFIAGFALYSKQHRFGFSRSMWIAMVMLVVAVLFFLGVYLPYRELWDGGPSEEWTHPPEEIIFNITCLAFSVSYSVAVIVCLHSFQYTLRPEQYRDAAFQTLIYITFISVLFFKGAFEQYRAAYVSREKIIATGATKLSSGK